MLNQNHTMLDNNHINFKDHNNRNFLLDTIDNEIKSVCLHYDDLKEKLSFFKQDNLNNLIFNLLDTFSNKPFQTFENFIKENKVENLEFFKVVLRLVRSSELFQKIIINKGQGTKYWKNTIIPILESGSAQDFLNDKYSFPFRIGLYPGVSCMFKCTFCGRNYDAVYDRDYASKGLEIFKKIIDEAPHNDPWRFFISGGLEPLTNPYLGDLIDYLKLKNFKAAIYTNGYMLTDKYLKKNDSIFSLDSLRISFYGVDDEETFSVTRKKKSFDIVVGNIVNYLKLKLEKKSQTSFGLNFVILKNKSSDLKKLFSLIVEINKRVGNGKNNFDFITLREDFRIFGSRMDKEEKNELIKNIFDIEERINSDPLLKGIHIDYGFALEALKNGHQPDSFEDNFASFEDIKILAMPQARLVVDLYGDVFLYGEAGFLDRPGAKRYIMGNLFSKKNIQEIIKDFPNFKKKVQIKEEDRDYLDAWDHSITRLAQQLKKNRQFGIDLDNGILNLEVLKKINRIKNKVHYSS